MLTTPGLLEAGEEMAVLDPEDREESGGGSPAPAGTETRLSAVYKNASGQWRVWLGSSGLVGTSKG